MSCYNKMSIKSPLLLTGIAFKSLKLTTWIINIWIFLAAEAFGQFSWSVVPKCLIALESYSTTCTCNYKIQCTYILEILTQKKMYRPCVASKFREFVVFIWTSIDDFHLERKTSTCTLKWDMSQNSCQKLGFTVKKMCQNEKKSMACMDTVHHCLGSPKKTVLDLSKENITAHKNSRTPGNVW